MGFRYTNVMDMGDGASDGMLTATEVACGGDFVFMRRADRVIDENGSSAAGSFSFDEVIAEY